MEETWRLWATIQAWWPAVEVLITHRITNAHTEAANTGIKRPQGRPGLGEPQAAPAWLRHVFATDDPTDELSAAWGVKEQLRRLLHVATLEQAYTEKMIMGCYVVAADMEETWRLWATIQAWWPAVEVLIIHRVTNAHTEAANTGIKQIKRTGRGYRNPAHYQARILLTSAARRAARTH
jgi:transposase